MKPRTAVRTIENLGLGCFSLLAAVVAFKLVLLWFEVGHILTSLKTTLSVLWP